MAIKPDIGAIASLTVRLAGARELLLLVCAAGLAACQASSAVEEFQAPTETRTGFYSGLSNREYRLAQDTRQRALEGSESGKTMSWSNPGSGTSGTTTPLKTWKTASGTYCRTYAETVRTGSGQKRKTGTACRDKDTVWKQA